VAAAPGALAQKKNCASAKTTGTGGDNRPSLRSGFTAYFVLFSVSFAFIATVAFEQPLEPNDSLTPSLSAPEPHDFAVRADAARLTAIDPSTAFRATSTAIAIRPLLGAERDEIYGKSEFRKRKIFLQPGLDRGWVRVPVGQIRADFSTALSAVQHWTAPLM